MRREHKVFLAAIFMAAGMAANSLPALGAVYVSDSLYDWEGNADSGQEEDREDGLTRITGPGEVYDTQEGETLKVEENVSGPSVTSVSLGERYHEEYKTYEESIGGAFFFYSNVANGGITDKPVTLDIPQNITCVLEKDGAPIPYTPGQDISGFGTYVARLSVVEDLSLPLSEQREYRAVFRFRIQEKPPQETEEQASESYQTSAGESGYGQGFSSALGGNETLGAGQEVETATAAEEGRTETSRAWEGQAAEEGQNAGEESLEASQPEASQEGQNPDGEVSEASPEGQNPGKEAWEASREGQNAADGGPWEGESGSGTLSGPGGTVAGAYESRTQDYDPATGLYLVTFSNGRTLTANVPEGYMGPSPVELSVSEGEAVLYRDDEAVEYSPGGSLTEPGHYRLEADGQSWSFTIGTYVNLIDRFLAPRGFAVEAVTLDGNMVSSEGGRYVAMGEDGQYQITMAGQGGENLEVVLQKDTTPPEFSVTVEGGTAQIQYLSQDIAQISLEKNGELQPGFSGYTITAPGDYTLTARDQAGNASSQNFTLKYRVNKYGILAVVLIILVIIGGAVFVVHVKKTVKVR